MPPLPICPNCGVRQRRPDARFCQQCGYPLHSVSAPVHAASPPTHDGKKRLWIGGALLAALIIAALLLFGPGRKLLPCCRSPKKQPVVIVTHTPIPAVESTVVAESSSSSPPSSSTATLSPTYTPFPQPTATPLPHPTSTPLPEPTATPRPTVTPTPVPVAHASQVVWLRRGPGTGYERIRKLAQGEILIPQGKSSDGAWLQVKTDNMELGWVSSSYVDLGQIDSAALPVVAAPPLPACQIQVDNRFRSVYGRDDLGCPTNAAHITWAAWQPFQGGDMLWRDDVNAVTIFYNGAGWAMLPDQWHGEPTPWRGNPPAGLRQPIRGFGWIWGNRDEVFNGLGWATDEEKGVCLIVQDFQKGFVFLKSNEAYCSDRAGNSNYNRAAELPGLFISAIGSGQSWRIH